MKENENREFRIGEIYLMKFSGEGNEQHGLRPGLVQSEHYSSTVNIFVKESKPTNTCSYS